MQTAATLSTDGDQAPRRCEIWGVLNVTPDSFSDGGRFVLPDAALAHVRTLLEQGADVLDIGGASSRPPGQLYGSGAAPVSEADELARVLPAVEAAVRLGARVSVDTTSAPVARAALRAGASIINDVSGGRSEALLACVAEHGAHYVFMHTRGHGEVVPDNTRYTDVLTEVTQALLAGVERAVRHGIARERVWIDPGLGFAKTTAQSAALLAHTARLVATGMPVLIGASRKGFIAELGARPSGERPSPIEREPGTLAAVTIAVLQGASAVRVHDVAGTWQALRVAEAIRRQGRGC